MDSAIYQSRLKRSAMAAATVAVMDDIPSWCMAACATMAALTPASTIQKRRF